MRRAVLTVAFALLAAPASAAEVTGWDGTNPFKCTLQQAGFEPTGPDPAADPYCVEFDKRRQNVTELGLIQFLSLEPARVAAAGPKCFYFQSDHWRGSIVQQDGSTKTYEWDGHYFFDKGRGEGGAWVSNFNVNGRTGDPSAYPGFPAEWAPYFGPGMGGTILKDGVAREPICAERSEREAARIYADASGARGTAPQSACRVPTGAVTSRSLGPVSLRDPERRVRELLGAPPEVRRGFLRFCADGGYRVGQRGDRSGELGDDPDQPTVVLLASNPAFRLHRVGPGSSARSFRRRFRRARRVGFVHGTAAYLIRRRAPVVFGLRGRRVAWVAVYDRRVIRTMGGLRTYLGRGAAD